MDTAERDKVIKTLLSEGQSLADVQRTLEDEYDEKITYMELRLISTELDVDWDALEPDEPLVTDDDDLELDLDDAANAGGATQISISKVQRPGAVFSGDVSFASGAEAEWFIDPMGQWGLNPKEGSSRPTQEDIQEFQQELQRQLQSQMGG